MMRKLKKGDYDYEKWVAVVDYVGVIDQEKRDWLINYFQQLEDNGNVQIPTQSSTMMKVNESKNKFMETKKEKLLKRKEEILNDLKSKVKISDDNIKWIEGSLDSLIFDGLRTDIDNEKI
jgi:hypothetical protein